MVVLSDSLRVGSSSFCGSHSSAELFPVFHQGESSPGGDRVFDRQRGCRTSPIVSRFLQSPDRGPEGFRVVETCDRPVVIERVRSTYAIQDGIQSVGSPVHQEFRLDDFHRSKGCLPSGSNSSIKQEVPEVCGRQPSLSIQGSLFRSPAPQVFTRVMALVSSFLHSQGVRMLRYLDDWLVLASSYQEALEARDKVLQLCSLLGIMVNLEKSSLVLSQTEIYLGMVLVSPSLRAFPTPKWIETVREQIIEFLSSRLQNVVRILARSLGLPDIVVSSRSGGPSLSSLSPASPSWTNDIRSNLQWWSDARNILAGVSLASPHVDHHFWSDASDQGWGAHIGNQFISGRWSQEEIGLSINLRELKAICLGLQHFQCQLAGSSVAVFSDNTTALAYVRKQGGTHSRLLNEEAQLLLRWAETQQILFLPQFVMGTHNVVADSLSRPNEVIGSEWTLTQDVVDQLIHRWPATIDLFATSLNHQMPVYFAPMSDPVSSGTDAFLQCWNHLQAYASPPFRLIRRFLNKFLESTNCEVTLVAPWWPQQEWFPDPYRLARFPPVALPLRRDLLRQPHFHYFHPNLQMLILHAWRL